MENKGKIKKNYIFGSLFLVFAFFYAPVKSQDLLMLKNGDTIKGKFLTYKDGIIEFKPTWASSLKISVDKISGLETKTPVKVEIKGEGIKELKLYIKKGLNKSLEEGVLKGSDFDSIGIVSINKQIEKFPKTKGSLSFGGTAVRGNSRFETVNFTGEGEARWKDERLSGDFKWIYQRTYDSQEHSYYLSQRAYFAGLKYDRFVSKDLFFYGLVRGESNYKQQIDWRLQGGVGAGWQVIDKDNTTLSVESGISYDRREYRTNDREGKGSIRFAFTAREDVTKSIQLFEKGEYLYSFEDSKDQSANLDIALRSMFSESFFAQLEWYFRWMSNVPRTAKRSDSQYMLSVGWRF